jgi:DNA repair protein RadA/Sms
MEDRGLVSESDPEIIFLSQSKKNMSGSVITSVLEGTRPILVEIQSLVVSTRLPIPRRVAQGLDTKKLELLLAVLTRRCGLPLYEYDCFINVAGGISIKNDPSTDLAVCLSVASSFFDKPLEARSVALGEVGLFGDIREVVAQDKRIKEARRLGYRNVITNKESNYLNVAIRKFLR